MEISAIANKIAEDARKELKKRNEELLSIEEFDKWFLSFKKTKQYKSLIALNKAKETFNEDYKGIFYKNIYGNEYPVASKSIAQEDLLKDIFRAQIKASNIAVSEDKIERDIIIAQAKNEDLDALIASLTEKYSK